MAKVLCVLYDDPVDGYPSSYPRADLPVLERYPDGQALPTPEAIDFTPGQLLGSVSGELGLRRFLESNGHELIVTSSKDGEDSVFERELPDADVVISQPFWPAYLTAERIAKAKKLKLVITAGAWSIHVLAALGEQDRPLDEIARNYERYASSGEINSTVEDQSSIVDRVRAWADVRKAGIDELDGLTVTAPESTSEMWWFNVRASNTEPLLRLNVEAGDRETMIRIRDEVLGLIRGGAAPARDEEERPE